MRDFTQAELESLFGPASHAYRAAIGVSTDSRTALPGNLFVCLQGDAFDGHNFVAQALEKGVSAIIASEQKRIALQPVCDQSSVPFYFVSDTLRALQRLAEMARSSLKCKVLAVAGSNGKTSTKDMLFTGASAVRQNVHATAGNLNNHIGLPLTLTNIPSSAGLVILELGMNHKGELAELSKIARPDHAIVTSIAEEHAEFFANIEEIAEAELEVAAGMNGGILLYHAQSAGQEVARRIAESHGLSLKIFSAESPSVDASGIHFTFRGNRLTNSNYLNLVMAENLTGALELLAAAGFTGEELTAAAVAAHPGAARRFEVFRRVSGGREILLIDDSYNANQASFEAGISSLRAVLPHGRLALFAGEMAELGHKSDEAHAQVGMAAALAGYTMLFACGRREAGLMASAYMKHKPDGKVVRGEKPAELLLAFSADDYDGILVKGSRRARMDIVSDEIKRTGFMGRSYV